MFELVWIALTAFSASLLTFFSGFGLGTVLLPVMLIFLPAEEAVPTVAVVHFLNNIFKFFLVGRKISTDLFKKFAIPSMAGAAIGAYCLFYVNNINHEFRFKVFDYHLSTDTINILMGALILIFAWIELSPKLKNLKFPSTYMPLGGAISGFFGGLSGHQGALRSMFLLRTDLSKEMFLATGITIALATDLIRILVYGAFWNYMGPMNGSYIISGVLAAFSGAFLGSRLFKKVTLSFFQNFVAGFLVLFGLALIIGLI